MAEFIYTAELGAIRPVITDDTECMHLSLSELHTSINGRTTSESITKTEIMRMVGPTDIQQ